MKETCIRLFSFRPEAYHSTEAYLNGMLSEGWRLRWCKGTFAGFIRTEATNSRYVVDPYAATSPMNLRRFPKMRLNEYMENGWYAVGKSKGAYIFYTENPQALRPELEENMAAKAISTCRISSLVFAIVLLAILWKCFTTPAILYSILLTDIYIALGALFLFLAIYHLVNAALLFTSPPKPDICKPRGCKRYFVHDGGVILLFLAAICLQARHQSSMLLYLLMPIGVVVIGTLVLKSASKGTTSAQENNKRLIPIICVIGVMLAILIPLSINRLQSTSTETNKSRQETLLAEAENLPVVHLADIIPLSETPKNAVQEYSSILGSNILYAEELGELSVFTNFTKMASPLLANHIFGYLYQQAQEENNETFQPGTYDALDYYFLEKAQIYLFQKEGTVYFCNIPTEADSQKLLQLLSSYLKENA